MGRRLGVFEELKRRGRRAFDFDKGQVAIGIGGGDAFDVDAVAVFVEERERGRAFDDVIVGDDQAIAGDEEAGALADGSSGGVVGHDADDGGAQVLEERVGTLDGGEVDDHLFFRR